MTDYWTYITIEEIVPAKFFLKSLEMEKDGWELVRIYSEHYSGFTLHKATFRKYET
jgi:hypothetical protein